MTTRGTSGRMWSGWMVALAAGVALVVTSPRAWAQTALALAADQAQMPDTPPGQMPDTPKTPKDPKAPKEKKPKKGLVQFLLVPHPELRIGKEVKIDFGLRIREEKASGDAQPVDQPELDIARRRVTVEGELFKAVTFKYSRELTSTDPVRDAWIGFEKFTFARIQLGTFKLPFSIDENTGATNMDFAYRSLAANHLAPGRDHGWMFHGQVLNHALGYEYGVFDHDGHNADPNNPERVTGDSTTAWRLTTQPLRNINSKWTDLEVGIAATHSDLTEGYSSIHGKTVLGQEFYNGHFLVNGARDRRSVEFRFRPGPFSLKSEYMKVTEERLGESVENSALSPLVSIGWYVSGTWAVTGETKSGGLDEPRHPLLQGGIGAVEVAIRVEDLSFASEAGRAAPLETGSTSHRADIVLGNSEHATTFGVNWYPNRYVKIQFNLIKEEISDPSQGPLPAQPSFWSKVLRVQFGL